MVGNKWRHRFRKINNCTLSNNNPQQLTVAILATLYEIFNSHNWPVDLDDSTSCFHRFRRTLSGLTLEEQNLLLSLTMRFTHLPMLQYLDMLVPLLNKLRQDYPFEKIYFVRCIKEEDVGKIKSCEAVLYQLKGTSLQHRIKLGKYKVVENNKTIKIDEIKSRDAIIVFVDDYIGTGDTAKGAIEYLEKCLPQLTDCTRDRFCFLTVAAYSRGKKTLESLGYKVYVSFEHDRGISDYYKDDEYVQNLQIMHNIENKISGLSPKYRLGYGKTEGLICMERCPNNTFPIYWFKEGDAPYERGHH